ncbi:MAG: FG-GAP-like repeat-containing protein [Nocardioidaceae bacterium]
MSDPSRTREQFVTACQQLLALGVVLAALTPAAGILSLEIVSDPPGRSPGAAYAETVGLTSRVPAAPVEARVEEVALTAATHARLDPGSLQSRVVLSRRGAEVVSRPQPVTGYGAVGVTWAPGTEIPDDAITIEARTATEDGWSDWAAMPYDDQHGPDPDSREGRRARPGTDALFVGEVDEVQVRVVTDSGAAPADLKLAVIDPGTAPETEVEAPAIDTATLDGEGKAVLASPDVVGEVDDVLALRAATYTPKPVIYSRAQWGADERIRNKASLSYFEVHAGFVHHTVNANEYSRAEVPGIIRSVYAYHVQSRGWSDVGYNFLVDRFGRIWEGRYGGVDRPVVGAHTLGYNDNAFAMSAIGNFDIKQPSAGMVAAYGALFAWKLSLHGVNAASMKQSVGSRNFPAVNGHRDADSTACPGKYLYAKLAKIRDVARASQRGWAGRELESDLTATPHPDVIVRRASDGQGFVIPTGGLSGFGPAETVSTVPSGATIVASPDLTGDRRSDILVQAGDGSAKVHPGTGTGAFGAGIKPTDAFAGHDLVTAVGDLNGDGNNDLVARVEDGDRLDAYLGGGGGGFTRTELGDAWGDYGRLAATGDLDGDGRVDLVARDRDGKLWLHPGTGSGGFANRVQVAGSWTKYDTIEGFGDFNRDQLADLFVRRADNGDAYVLPGRGNGSFGHPFGPIVRLRGVGAITGGGNLAGGAAPDLLAREGTKLVLFRNDATIDTGRPIATGADLSNANVLLNAGDWDRDGIGDIITRNQENGALYVRRGDGKGHFGEVKRIATGFAGVRLLAAVGDMTGDGWPDLMGQPSGGDMRIYPGRGLEGLKPSYVAYRTIDASRQIAVGRWDGDGAPDSLFGKGSRLTLYPGNGPGGLTTARTLGLDLEPYDWVIGVSDVHLTGHPDLILRQRRTGYLWLVEGSISGFSDRRFLAEGMKAYDLAG